MREFTICRACANTTSVKNASTDVLEYILNHDDCDPDLRNRLDGDTPLHIAVRDKFADHPGARLYMGTEKMRLQPLTGHSRSPSRGRCRPTVRMRQNALLLFPD
jgi:hypothetical protein